jgi:hypothetical protein
MIGSSFLANLVSPQIIFFCLGTLGALVRFKPCFPAWISKTLPLTLLGIIGFKGGTVLYRSGLTQDVLLAMGASVCAAIVVPAWVFMALRRRFGVVNAAGLAASFGAVSSVTFLAACAYLSRSGVAYSGHMISALALMDAPAILAGLLFARWFSSEQTSRADHCRSWSGLAGDVFLTRPMCVLLGTLILGVLFGSGLPAAISKAVDVCFTPLLSVFLLEMGLVAGGRIGDLPALGRSALFLALGAPLVNALLGLGFAVLAGLGRGDAFLLVVLSASASYIAAPATLRSALPEANPGIYLTLSLGVVFPFNLVIGLPIYRHLVELCVR